MTLQARTLPARRGVDWVRGGWTLFRRQPLGFMSLVLAELLVLALLAQLPVVGVVLVSVLAPGFSAAFFVAGRAAEAGRPVLATMLVEPFRMRAGALVRPLLLLGVFLLAASTIAQLPLMLAFDPAPADSPAPAPTAPPVPDAPSDAPPAPGNTGASEAEMREFSQRALATFATALPVILGFWFAPALVAFHDVAPAKALFFSVVAVWRNLGAFVVYGLALGAIGVLVSLVLLIALQATGGSAAVSLALVIPASVGLAALAHTSAYASYRATIAEQDDATDAAPGAA